MTEEKRKKKVKLTFTDEGKLLMLFTWATVASTIGVSIFGNIIFSLVGTGFLFVIALRTVEAILSKGVDNSE